MFGGQAPFSCMVEWNGIGHSTLVPLVCTCCENSRHVETCCEQTRYRVLTHNHSLFPQDLHDFDLPKLNV